MGGLGFTHDGIEDDLRFKERGQSPHFIESLPEVRLDASNRAWLEPAVSRPGEPAYYALYGLYARDVTIGGITVVRGGTRFESARYYFVSEEAMPEDPQAPQIVMTTSIGEQLPGRTIVHLGRIANGTLRRLTMVAYDRGITFDELRLMHEAEISRAALTNRLRHLHANRVEEVFRLLRKPPGMASLPH